MKNKLLLIVPLITLLAVPACHSSNNGNKKGDVVSKSVLKANTEEIRKQIFNKPEAFAYDFPTENVINTFYQNGFGLLNTSDNKISFYSVIKEKIICSIDDSIHFNTYPSNVAGGFLSYTNTNGLTIMDALGNTLVFDSKRTYSSLTISEGINENHTYYCEIKFDDISLYFLYDSTGAATVHSTSIGDDFNTGTTIQGLDYVLLDDFGHKGYQRIKNSSRYIIFDNKGNEISSFTDPQADASFFVGDYLIYQNSVKLDNNNNNYDFISESGERYSLETYRINYLTAKKEAINVDYLLSTGSDDIHSFRNAKGIYAYAYANLRTISDKKILSNTHETYILDSAGERHDNVTGINLGAFVRIGTNFYNTDSETIYDGNLNELSILTNTNPQRIENADLIVCTVEGKYGAVNQNGKVVLPFVYDKIYTNYISDNRVLVDNDGVLQILEFDVKDVNYTVIKGYESVNSVSYVSADMYKIDDEYVTLSAGGAISMTNDGEELSLFYISASLATDKVELISICTTETVLSYKTASIAITH